MTRSVLRRLRSLELVLALCVALGLGIYLGALARPFPATSDDSSLRHYLKSFSQSESSQLLRLREELHRAQDRIRELQASPALVHVAPAAPSSPPQASSIASIHPICQKLPQPIPNALSLWMNNLPVVHNATRLVPNEVKFYFHDYIAQLLQVVSPHLPRSTVALPQQQAKVKQILDKAWKRWNYLQDPASTPFAPPIRILVLGGSVLVGRNCRKLIRDLNIQGMILPNRHCTWSHRLDVFLQQVFGERVVEITKIAMGGTNTLVGSQIWNYNLLPDEARDPDVVINAYSTNDMHILTMLQAQDGNQTLRDCVFVMTQSFCRSVLGSCRPPLLLHLDDYLGNEQREIWATTEASQGVQVLAHYYGFGSLSYANLVRRWVYADTRETWFSPEGWWAGRVMEREIHPGMGAHITIMWVVAYNLLNIVTNYCSYEGLGFPTGAEYEYAGSKYEQLIPLQGWFDKIPGMPKIAPNNRLPPWLDKNLSLEHVSQLWSDEPPMESCSDGDGEIKCPFSWLSGISQQQNDKTWIDEYFDAHSEGSHGWKLNEDGEKLGLVPSDGADVLMVKLQKLSQPVQSITAFFLKSYGEKWHGSRATLSVDSGEASMTLVGEHEKKTSEMYTETLTLDKPKQPGDFFAVKLQLSGGSTFKLMGLAVCRLDG